MSLSYTSASPAPILETLRLRLRGHTTADLDRSIALWSDAEVTRYIGGRPFTREECWSRLLRYAGHWQLLGFGCWVIEDKATHEFLGEVGVWDYKREFDPLLPEPLTSQPEVGWMLDPAHQGKGLAAEAVQAALEWARQHGFDRFWCIIAPDNLPSLRLAARCGFEESLRTSYKGNPTIVLTLS
jgi:RimJ/RimL family protein N-acetyltransferase